MQFHKAIFYFNPKMGHMLNLAMVDKLNRAGFVVAPHNTPEGESSVKSVSGPARHVGEANNRVRDRGSQVRTSKSAVELELVNEA